MFKMGGESPSISFAAFITPFTSPSVHRPSLFVLRKRHQGAVLEDMPADDEVSSMKFAGSTIIVVAESREAVVNVLKDDIYVKSGVWDLEKVCLP